MQTKHSGPFERHREEWKGIQRVAWIRPGALGDLVVGLASLVETHHAFPNAKITIVGPHIWVGLLSPEVFPYIERIAVVERKSTTAKIFALKAGEWVSVGQGLQLSEVLSDCQAMVNTNVDSTRYGFTGLRARVPIRIGSAPRWAAWLYTHAAPHFGKDPLVHERDLPLLLLEYAQSGCARFQNSVGKNRAELPRWLEESSLVKHWRKLGLPQMKKLSLPRVRELTKCEPGRYILVNPTASRREKTWPSERMHELLLTCESELKKSGVEALVIGAPNETEWLNEVARGRYRVLQPKDLYDLQDIVYGARMLLTNGSSMQFIAGTTQTPTLTIFGRGQPAIWGPVGPFDQTVRAKFTGADQGSTFAGFEEEARIYRTISVDDVKATFLSVLATPYSKPSS